MGDGVSAPASGPRAHRSGAKVEQNEQVGGVKRFGTYLRRVREGRRLSLDAVEELSTEYPERITKSHLSRIENGQALPTFPRLFALGQIYGVPVATLAERFEVDFQLERLDSQGGERLAFEAMMERAATLRQKGDYAGALDLYRGGADDQAFLRPQQVKLKLGEIGCLIHLGRYELAKNECEAVLGTLDDVVDRTIALSSFVNCCYRLGRFAVAALALEQARAHAVQPGVPKRVHADLEALSGHLFVAMRSYAAARDAFASAMDAYAAIPNDFEACRTRINLGFSRFKSGDEDVAVKDLEGAAAEAESRGYERQLALCWSHLGHIALERGDVAAAERFVLKSNVLARKQEYVSLVFRNCYVLWQVARRQGDHASERTNERTLRAYLGRVEDYLPEAEAFRAYLGGAA